MTAPTKPIWSLLAAIVALLLFCIGCRDMPNVESREVNKGWRLVKRADGGYSFRDSQQCTRFSGDRDDWRVLVAAFNEMEQAEKSK